MNIETMISELRASQDTLRVERDGLLAGVEERQEKNLTEQEQSRFTELIGELRRGDERLAELVESRDAERKAQAAIATLDDESRDKPPHVSVGREEHIYRQGGQHHFLRDAYRSEFTQDREASERIGMHQAQMSAELRAVGTGAFTGLVVPQYLVDLYAPKARAGRPFLEAVRGLPLPEDGMTVNISRITTGTAVAAQATEGTAAQNTDIDDTLLTVNVRTYAGQQDVSRQAIERGQLVEEVTLADLVAAYHTSLDSAAIGADGTSGTHLGVLSTSGINAVTYTDATPTVGELYPKFSDAIQQVNSNYFSGADLIVMHPRRWGFITAALDTTNRPLSEPSAGGPMNVVAYVREPGQYGGPVGMIQGLPVVTDGNVPTNLGAGTNEDRIIVCSSQDIFIWENGGGPMQLRFEQTLGGNLQIKLVVFDYSAFTAGRQPAAVSVISGTGLVTPTF